MTAQLPMTAAQLPPASALDASSMLPHERTEHRRAIAGVVQVILNGYWRPDDSDEMRAAILRDWCDTLENWKPESILAALRQWRDENPDKRPNPGHIVRALKNAWGKRHADQVRAALAPPVEQPKQRVGAQRAAEIMAELGIRNPLAAKTIDGITPSENM